MENKIYKAIADIMGEIGAIGKNSKNSQQGFMYRGIDAVMNAINPALVKHKVFIVPEVLEQTREERQTSKGSTLFYSICKVRYTFYAEDGSSIEAVVAGEGMDSGDKATTKAMSIAFKYACFQVFCIPTEEMIDPDSEGHEVAPKKDGNKPNEEPKKAPKQEQPNKASAKQIEAIKGCVQDIEAMLKFYKVDKIEDLTIQQASQVIAAKGGNK